MDLGLVAYRPYGSMDPAGWDATFAAGEWEFMGILAEAPRYAVLISYMTALHPDAPSILDVGCGPGVLRSRIGSRPIGRYVGIDHSAVAIAQAKDLEDDVTHFMVAAEPTPELGTFDVVVCSEMLYYLLDLKGFLLRVHSALRPGGHLLCSSWQHPRVAALQRSLDARFPPVASVDLTTRVGRSLHWRVSCHRRPED